jgi:hypothetical protein
MGLPRIHNNSHRLKSANDVSPLGPEASAAGGVSALAGLQLWAEAAKVLASTKPKDPAQALLNVPNIFDKTST